MPFDQLTLVNPFLNFLQGELLFEGNDLWQGFDLIAVDESYQGVAINLWILNAKTFTDIAQFKKDRIVSLA